MLITKTIEVDMGHRVPNHESKCKNLHGHRYRIEVGVDDRVIENKGASNEGMVIDFGDLKEKILTIDKTFDHGFVMYRHDKYYSTFHRMKEEGMKIKFVDFIPTAENLAKYWFEKLEIVLRPIQIQHVKVWETPTSTAIYTYQDSLKYSI